MSDRLAVEMREWEVLTPGVGPGEPLSGRMLDSPAARADAQRLSRAGMLLVRELSRGLELEATSYVGKVRLGDIEVTITPKIRGGSLLRLFRYAYELRDLKIEGEARFAEDGSLFLDLLLSQLRAEVQELLSRGLQRRYVAVAEDLASPRGRIDMGRIATQNALGSGSLPCRHHLRLEDCLINQVLLAGLRLGASLATDRGLAADLHRLGEALATAIRTVPLTGARIDQARRGVDRLTSAYAPVLEILELLLDGVSPALDGDDATLLLSGFLFDMNRFFQRLVGRFLRECLEGYKLREEQSIQGMLRYAPGENPRNRRPPRPRPDFVVVAGDGKKTLLDAKYRDLWERDLPREMLYQLSVYALSQGQGGQATILYPTIGEDARAARIEICDPMDGWGRAAVVLQPIHLEKLDRLVTAGGGAIARAARSDLAQRMVFGSVARVPASGG